MTPNEELARNLTEYLSGGAQHFASLAGDEAFAIILSALNTATAERDREIAELRADKERLDWMDRHMSEYLIVEIFGMDVEVDKPLRDIIDQRRNGG